MKLGFRPEALEVTTSEDGTLPIKVELVEELGSDAYVYGKLAETDADDTQSEHRGPRRPAHPAGDGRHHPPAHPAGRAARVLRHGCRAAPALTSRHGRLEVAMTSSLLRAQVDIDLDAIRHNLTLLGARAPGAEVMAVVKADAYGHGALPVARAAVEAGAGWLGTCSLGEALALREAGITTRLFSWLDTPDVDFAPGIEAGRRPRGQLAG